MNASPLGGQATCSPALRGGTSPPSGREASPSTRSDGRIRAPRECLEAGRGTPRRSRRGNAGPGPRLSF